MNESRVALEIIVDSVEGALAAQSAGADRVELCSALLEGGLTPSLGMATEVRRQIQIGLQAMLRPRGGDFCYSDDDFAVMQVDLSHFKTAGVNGVVFGILLPDGSVDRERSAQLVAQARPLSVTFHRAFDMASDPFQALDVLIDLGIDRVLTSGQERTALEGSNLIAELVRRAAGRIIVMPGGGITDRNVHRILAETGAQEIHASAHTSVDGPMNYRNSAIHMGGALYPPEFSRSITDVQRVAALRASTTA
jgi:copper homeostasis protein